MITMDAKESADVSTSPNTETQRPMSHRLPFRTYCLLSPQVVEFIKLHNIFTPNGTSLVKDIEVGDVVVLGRQPCLVTGISDPFSTTSPLDLDESNNPKVAVQITGQSVFWPDIDYEACFLLKDGNKIGTLGGPPDICERVPVVIISYLLEDRASFTHALTDQY